MTLISMLKEQEFEFVEFRFTDLKGKWHHTSYMANQVDEKLLASGIMFDGSSIEGWKSIEMSDMVLMPDTRRAFADPFAARPTLIVTCDVIDPSTGQPYLRDPRSTAKKAEQYLKTSQIGDVAYFGPELEFFLFDDVRYACSMNESFFRIDAKEAPYNSSRIYGEGNLAHRPVVKGGYFPVPPMDSLNDIRAEMLVTLKEVGLEPLLHHHEVAPGQCELGFLYSTLVETADNVQRYKYVVHNVAEAFGKSATFMPKPVLGDNGSGMHVHQSIWRGETPLFAGDQYANLSEMALYYIGGIIKHAKALNAFTNSSTNSYKRLVPGYEAPVMLAYSACNRSASIRIPYVTNEKAKRIEVRFPDPSANPYYAFAAMLMAGLDGINNKIHPGDAIDKNLYHLEKNEHQKIPTVCGSLKEALAALSADRDFLKKGDVFSDDQIDAYIDVMMTYYDEVNMAPHPMEFKLYYGV